MEDDIERRLAKVQFIRGSIGGLIRMAEADRMEMLAYLLEMAQLESAALEASLKDERAKFD